MGSTDFTNRGAATADRSTPNAHHIRHRATVVMQVSGAVTAVSVRVLEHGLAEVVGRIGGRAPRVLLDLADMTFIDRAGLDMLLDWQERVVGVGGEFELMDPSATVIRMLYAAAIDPRPR